MEGQLTRQVRTFTTLAGQFNEMLKKRTQQEIGEAELSTMVVETLDSKILRSNLWAKAVDQIVLNTCWPWAKAQSDDSLLRKIECIEKYLQTAPPEVQNHIFVRYTMDTHDITVHYTWEEAQKFKNQCIRAEVVYQLSPIK